MPAFRTSTARSRPVLTVGRVTRAHVAVAFAKEWSSALARSVERMAEALSAEVKRHVSVSTRLLPAAASGRETLANHAVFALLEAGGMGTSALLEIESTIAGAFVDALAGGPGALSAPYAMSDVERAALGFLCLATVAAFRRDEVLDRCVAPRLVRIIGSAGEAAAAHPLSDGHIAVEIRLRVGESTGFGRLLVPSAPVAATASRAIDVASRPTPFDAQVVARAFAESVNLDPTEAERLGCGDVVLMSGSRLADGRYLGQGRLRASSFSLVGVFAAEGFTVERAVVCSNPEDSMAAKTPKPPLLPVEVEIELTRVRIPVTELSRVEAGAILPLHVTPADGVVLRVGGQVVARAELVDVEGEIGARIVSIES